LQAYRPRVVVTNMHFERRSEGCKDEDASRLQLVLVGMGLLAVRM
jgi:hypothetical protein